MAEGNNINPPAQEQSPLECYDITGKNWHQVIKKLKTIVNCEDYKSGAIFSIMIKPTSMKRQDAFQKKFQLKAEPERHQPGNGKLSILQGGKFIARPYDEEMVEDLEEMYGEDTSPFAEHLNTLFSNNETIAKYPFVTSEVYMLLLFEKGRRLVKDSPNSTDRKKRYDKLAIKSAIEDILKLLENKKCGFRDVFLKEGTFHCFSGKPEQREKAIENITEAAEKIKNTSEEIKKAAEEIKRAAEEIKKAAEEMRTAAKEFKKTAEEIKKAPKKIKKEAEVIGNALSADEEGETNESKIDNSLSTQLKKTTLEDSVSD